MVPLPNFGVVMSSDDLKKLFICMFDERGDEIFLLTEQYQYACVYV